MEEERKHGLSFGFSKKKDSSKLQKSAIKDEDANARVENSAFVDSFDGKQLYTTRKEKKDLVIPLISTNRWQKPLKPEDFDQETDDKTERHVKKVDGNTIDSEAANELLKEAAYRQYGSDEEKERSTFTVPLLMANKVPEGFETDERLDVSLRPEGSIEADYAEVPIEDYGFAMLRGMGWKEGTGIGKKGRLAKPVEAVLRPKGMGLGADRSLAKQNAGQAAENADSEAAKLTYKKGVNCVITNGKHKDLYGTVEGVDEDNSRVVVKMTLSRESITISQFAARLVTKKDYDQNSKVLNKAKVDKYKDEENRKKEKHRKDDRDREDRNGDRERGDEKDRRRRDDPKEKKRKHDESSSSSSSKHQKSSSQSQKRMWLRPSLRVRIVDPEYKKGKYFKTKVIIEDVIDQGVCICRTEEGKVLENVYQSMLETVIPRSEPSYVMIVSGKHTGKLGELLRKDKGTSEAVIQLLEDRDMAVSLRFDDICDYTGNIDDDFNY